MVGQEVINRGIIGCGAISGAYLKNSKLFDVFDIVAVADVRKQAAQSRAEEYDVPKAYTVEELLADPEVEIVINLTPHSAHGEVGIATLEAGKSTYNEKPLAVYREDGQKMLELAKSKQQGDIWEVEIVEPMAEYDKEHGKPVREWWMRRDDEAWKKGCRRHIFELECWREAVEQRNDAFARIDEGFQRKLAFVK